MNLQDIIVKKAINIQLLKQHYIEVQLEYDNDGPSVLELLCTFGKYRICTLNDLYTNITGKLKMLSIETGPHEEIVKYQQYVNENRQKILEDLKTADADWTFERLSKQRFVRDYNRQQEENRKKQNDKRKKQAQKSIVKIKDDLIELLTN